MSDIIKRLEGISLFKAFKDNREALGKIASLIHVQTFKAGTYIIREGESGEAMFILNKGTVRVEKETLSKDKFTVVNLSDGMNIFFGEVALMDNDVRSASVFAVSDTECYEIRKNDFEKLCDANPAIGYNVIKEIVKSLSGRLRKTNSDSITLLSALIDDETCDDLLV